MISTPEGEERKNSTFEINRGRRKDFSREGKEGVPCAGPGAEVWDSTREEAAHGGASRPLLLSRVGLQHELCSLRVAGQQRTRGIKSMRVDNCDKLAMKQSSFSQSHIHIFDSQAALRTDAEFLTCLTV